MDADEHAQRADELLAGVERRLDAMTDLTPDQDLQMRVSGGYKQHNTEVETSLELARTHALTSIAMRGTLPAGLLERSGDQQADAADIRRAT